MTSTMSYPAAIQPLPPPAHQNYKQQKPHQQQPTSSPYSEGIEMRPRTGFARLPQDPPLQQHVGSHQMETTMSNGVPSVPMNTSQNFAYPQPPSYTMEDRVNFSNGTVPGSNPHHFPQYEELPIQGTMETSTDHISLEEGKDLQRQESHTEVDQYYNPPVHSISSTARLTITEPNEKRPRKKVNPVYDRYQGPTEKITTSKGGSQQKSKPPSKGNCRKYPSRCLRHPCTIVFIFALVALVIVAVVLIMLGTIETPGSLPEGPDRQVQATLPVTSMPTTTLNPDAINSERLLSMIEEQQRTIMMLQEKITMLEGVLGGGDEANATLSTRVALISFKIEGIDASIKSASKNITEVNQRVSVLQDSLSGTLVRLESTVIRTSTLENNTRQLERSVSQLNAKAQTQSIDIQTNKEKNDEQDNTISNVQQELWNLSDKFDLNLAEANRTIFDRLDTISKMQGPRGYNGSVGPAGLDGAQGPAGAGDLTQCDHQIRTSSSSYGSPTSGGWETPPSDKIFTGVTCTTIGGTHAVLLSEDLSSGAIRYRCRCGGQSSEITESRRQCNMHFWQCPATS
ncbi:uncharacterized protein [Asterias amurensis]|uniref:uncharacterized protein n=1 Tax=Asterias amurensis TaxID=7602 RepID=UPI003AB13016